ncbi:hypothetical protein HAX54_019955, partial [Datura stramonium]|nr:hypothetical protein [Datura stramonium]
LSSAAIVDPERSEEDCLLAQTLEPRWPKRTSSSSPSSGFKMTRPMIRAKLTKNIPLAK